MNLFKQLWITSAPFRVLTCVGALSLVVAVTTADVPDSAHLPQEVETEDEGGLLDTIRDHLPGQKPKTPIDAATDAVKTGVDFGKKSADVMIDATGDMAGKVYDAATD